MPELLTRGDSLREYLTGAASDGGAQADQAASFGNFRSSSEVGGLAIGLTDAINHITVDYASGGNPVGDGSLRCTGINTLIWEDGTSVTIMNGESKLLEADGNPGGFLRVSRISAIDLTTGIATVTLEDLVNNVLGFGNITSALAASGVIHYRGIILKNVASHQVMAVKKWIASIATSQISDSHQLGASGSGTITTTGTFADWPETGYCHIYTSAPLSREIIYYSSRTDTVLTVPSAGRALLGSSAAAGASTDVLYAVSGIAIAIDTAGVQAAGSSIQTIANETSAPTSVTWNTGIDASLGLNIGNMNPGQLVGIWIKRQIPVGAIAVPLVTNKIGTSFEAV